MKRIQERFKEDRQRMNQEMMKMYQEHGVNPLSSCLPLLLQLPFFIALFYLLRGSEFKADIRGAESFLFIPDLAEKLTNDVGVLVVMIVLYVGTQLAATSITAFSADPMQRRIMFALPFVFVPFIINFPAGLLVYWITTNVWTIGQQLLVKKLFPKPDPIEPKEDDGAAPARGKPRAPKPAAGTAAAAVGKAEAKQSKDGKDGKDAKDGAKRRGGGAKPATASGGGGNGARAAKPPQSPRKKKKRSGRRR
jgi:YidC/Oxa1 family membrane protein insertase